MSNPNEDLRLRPLTDQRKRIGETIKYNLKSAWYFDKWYEKIILIALGILAFMKIMEWII